MKSASLYDCFDRHLHNFDLVCETEEVFVLAVVERFLINIGGHGYHLGTQAEDTFNELCLQVNEMLKKKIYGYVNLDDYRQKQRQNLGI